MNLQPYLAESWQQQFPGESTDGLPQLLCLNASAFSGIPEQCDAISQALEVTKGEMAQAAKILEQKKFLIHFLNQSVQRLTAVSQLFSTSASSSSPNIPHTGISVSESEDSPSMHSSASRQSIPAPSTSATPAIAEKQPQNEYYQQAPRPESFSPRATSSGHYPPSSPSGPGTFSLTLPGATSHIPASSSSSPKGNRYNCRECNRHFSSKAVLEAHVLRHTGEKPFACDLCDRRFRQRIQLNSHLRTHSDERPYGCVLCGKKFRQQSHIIQHLKVHSGEKPHVCHKCGRDFKQKVSLEKHTANQCRGRQRVTTHERIGETLWYGLANNKISSNISLGASTASASSSAMVGRSQSHNANGNMMPMLSTSLHLPPLISGTSTLNSSSHTEHVPLPLPGMRQAFGSVLPPCDMKME